MKKYHQSKRGMGGFEEHKCGRGAGDVRHGRAWRFMMQGYDPLDPHSRRTSRSHALSGGHVREVKEPAKSAHGRGF